MRFEITINGIPQCRAGIKNFGVLSATLSRVKRNPARIDASKLQNTSYDEFCKEKVEFEVGGLDSNSDNADANDGDFFHYMREELKPGDELIIRILPPGKYDEPKRKAKKIT